MRRAEDVVEILGPGGQLDLEAMRSVMNARLK
jgi:hypothetical protein